MQQFARLIPASVLAQTADPVGRRLFCEYGAVFVARGGSTAPDRLIFKDQSDVSRFQNSVSVDLIIFDQIKIELQSAAAKALREAIAEAGNRGLTITPRSADSGRRSYDDTVLLWQSRVDPALDHWVSRQRISSFDAMRIRSLSPFEQVPKVLGLEEHGIFFAKDLSKTILHSVAPPGTSQHLSMLAFDVAEFNEPQIRRILTDHFWYQTVPSDLPHFTYLGVPEYDLPILGLKCITDSHREFWIPDM